MTLRRRLREAESFASVFAEYNHRRPLVPAAYFQCDLSAVEPKPTPLRDCDDTADAIALAWRNKRHVEAISLAKRRLETIPRSTIHDKYACEAAQLCVALAKMLRDEGKQDSICLEYTQAAETLLEAVIAERASARSVWRVAAVNIVVSAFCVRSACLRKGGRHASANAVADRALQLVSKEGVRPEGAVIVANAARATLVACAAYSQRGDHPKALELAVNATIAVAGEPEALRYLPEAQLDRKSPNEAESEDKVACVLLTLLGSDQGNVCAAETLAVALFNVGAELEHMQQRKLSSGSFTKETITQAVRPAWSVALRCSGPDLGLDLNVSDGSMPPRMATPAPWYACAARLARQAPKGLFNSMTEAALTRAAAEVRLLRTGAVEGEQASRNKDADSPLGQLVSSPWTKLMHLLYEQAPRAYNLFQELDDDKSGFLSMNELKRGLRRLCVGRACDTMSERDLEHIQLRLDANGDGLISFKEFQSLIQQAERRMFRDEGLQKRLRKQDFLAFVALRLKCFTASHRIRLRDVFLRADIDESGTLTKSELRAVLRSLGVSQPSKREMQTILLVATNDGKGDIDYHRFEAILKKHGAHANPRSHDNTTRLMKKSRSRRVGLEYNGVDRNCKRGQRNPTEDRSSFDSSPRIGSKRSEANSEESRLAGQPNWIIGCCPAGYSAVADEGLEARLGVLAAFQLFDTVSHQAMESKRGYLNGSVVEKYGYSGGTELLRLAGAEEFDVNKVSRDWALVPSPIFVVGWRIRESWEPNYGCVSFQNSPSEVEDFPSLLWPQIIHEAELDGERASEYPKAARRRTQIVEDVRLSPKPSHDLISSRLQLRHNDSRKSSGIIQPALLSPASPATSLRTSATSKAGVIVREHISRDGAARWGKCLANIRVALRAELDDLGGNAENPVKKSPIPNMNVESSFTAEHLRQCRENADMALEERRVELLKKRADLKKKIDIARSDNNDVLAAETDV